MSDPADIHVTENEALATLARHIEADAGMILDMATHIEEQVHTLVKRHCCTMPSALSAMAVGMHVAAQIACESVLFAERSLEEGEDEVADEKALVRKVLFRMLVELLDAVYPGELSTAVLALDGPTLPPSHVAVPVEPTPEMIEAGWTDYAAPRPLESERERLADAYRAMIAAAPGLSGGVKDPGGDLADG